MTSVYFSVWMLVFFFFISRNYLYIKDINSLWYVWKHFSQFFFGLLTLLMVYISYAKIFFKLCHRIYAYGFGSKLDFWLQDYKTNSNFSIIFYLVFYTFKSLIHLEFILVYTWMYGWLSLSKWLHYCSNTFIKSALIPQMGVYLDLLVCILDLFS